MKLFHKQWSCTNRIYTKMSKVPLDIICNMRKQDKGNEILNKLSFYFTSIRTESLIFKFDAPALKNKRCYFTQTWNEIVFQKKYYF